MEHPSEPSPPQLLLTIPQVAQSLGFSPAYVYRLIATAGLPTLHFGRAVRVSVASLQKWIAEREEQESSA